MSDEVVRIGDHLPMTSRRVVPYMGGKPASWQTGMGRIEGLADGVVLLRYFRTKLHLEFTVKQAREVASAMQSAAYAVEQWQERASGFNTIRVFRSPSGDVTVEYRGRSRPMRLSKLRGYVDYKGERQYRRGCNACHRPRPELYVPSDVIREHGSRVQHVLVCPDCVERLATDTRTAVATLVRR
jgi:hypothetical protein